VQSSKKDVVTSVDDHGGVGLVHGVLWWHGNSRGGGQLGFDLNFAKFRRDEGLFIGLFVLIPLEGFGSWCGLLLQGREVDEGRWAGVGRVLEETREARKPVCKEMMVTWAGWCWTARYERKKWKQDGLGFMWERGGLVGLGWLGGNLRIRAMAGIKNRKVFLIFESFTNCKSI
jgi:hypothetical protein